MIVSLWFLSFICACCSLGVFGTALAQQFPKEEGRAGWWICFALAAINFVLVILLIVAAFTHNDILKIN